MSVRGKIFRRKYITREAVQGDRDSVFVFGDNMIGKGMGGQAGQMRGEPNTIGVPTKWSPSRLASAYFTDGDWDKGDVRHAIFSALRRIKQALDEGRHVIIPSDGLGTGLAELPVRAPKIHAFIENSIASLENSND